MKRRKGLASRNTSGPDNSNGLFTFHCDDVNELPSRNDWRVFCKKLSDPNARGNHPYPAPRVRARPVQATF